MHAKTNIHLSLKQRRRKHFMLKMYICLFLTFLAIIIFAFLTNYSGVKIQKISVKGVSSISESDISNFVKAEISSKYLYVFAKDNILLLPRYTIKKDLLDNFKKIEVAKVSLSGLRDIEITIKERVQTALWCKDKCFFMDSNGLIFAEAPEFSGTPFPEYFGLINKENPIGENYFNSEKFIKISELFENVKKLGFPLEKFVALDVSEYEMIFTGGGKIAINDKQDFSESFKNLKAIVDNGLIKTDEASLKKINHIDLRYNKVHYDFK
jgi:hypothetical protein